MSDIYFSNINIKKYVEYFLYIGEIKNYGLNFFLAEALSGIKGRAFDFISIAPDIFAKYHHENLMIVNPLALRHLEKTGIKINCRVPANEFMTYVSENREVKSLVKRILENQDSLYIYMYESIPEMTLDSIPGVSVLGPGKEAAHRLNSKIFQRLMIKDHIPLPEGFIADGLEELLDMTGALWKKWKDGIFVTEEYSAAGANSIVAQSAGDISKKFLKKNETYLATRFIPHDFDPTVLGVVANEDQVYIAGVADQRIEHGTRFTGSTFPSVLEKKIVSKLIHYTRIAGKLLAKEGYKGIFGCDYIVDKDKNIYFVEINARKQGTTFEFCCALEQSLPADAPLLPELEYFAVTKNRLPENAVELKPDSRLIHWGTYNYKVFEDVLIEGDILKYSPERDAFASMAKGLPNRKHLVMEHAGTGFITLKNSFLARVVALGSNHADVKQGISRGIKEIESTISDKKRYLL